MKPLDSKTIVNLLIIFLVLVISGSLEAATTGTLTWRSFVVVAASALLQILNRLKDPDVISGIPLLDKGNK